MQFRYWQTTRWFVLLILIFAFLHLAGANDDELDCLHHEFVKKLTEKPRIYRNSTEPFAFNKAANQQHASIQIHLLDSISELPDFVQKNWNTSKKIKFPMSFSDSVATAAIQDRSVLKKLSTEKLLSQPEPRLGWVLDQKIFIETVSDETVGKRQALINIDGRHYLVEVDLPQVAETANASYRTNAKNQKVWRAALNWEAATSEEQRFLRSKKALGITVQTSNGSLFTRVADQDLDQIGDGVTWLDEEAKVLWSDVVSEKNIRANLKDDSWAEVGMSSDEAKFFCDKFSGALPTRQLLTALVHKNAIDLMRVSRLALNSTGGGFTIDLSDFPPTPPHGTLCIKYVQ